MSSRSSGMTVSAMPSSVPLLDSSGSSSSFTTATPTSSSRTSSFSSGTSRTDVTSMTNEPSSSSSSLSAQQDRTSVASQETQTIAPGTAASTLTESSSIEVEPVQTIPAVSPIASLSDAGTTLSTSISVTMTYGDTTITTVPVFVTSISVSSGTGGSAKTLTSVFANPTNATSSSGLRDWTFWDNRGAIAGVFVTVALTVIASLLGLFFCCRRRRRRQAQRDANLSRGTGRGFGPYARDDPQRGLMAPSITSGGSVAHDDVEPARHSYLQRSSSEGHTIALGLTDMLEHAKDRPFNDRYRHITVDEPRIIELTEAQPVEIVTFSDHKPDPAPSTAIPAEKSSPSPTPSSPSIYPPSLSPVQEKDEDDYLFYERETQRKSVQHWLTPPPRAHVTDIDSQNPFPNPFKPVNDATGAIITPESCPPRIQTGQAYMPLTPPDSSLGHSPLPSSPVTPQSSELERETRKHSNPFSNAFLGRPVLGKIEPLPRPKRSLLRMPASDVSLNER
ncbi:hypothetical protein DFH11DRAFT_1722015 [Phellopilus nigrolimitatus]|nr:hypothetical protein DFH11DRAFT_1722015 [Phellopilus nigrolimitatus]